MVLLELDYQAPSQWRDPVRDAHSHSLLFLLHRCVCCSKYVCTANDLDASRTGHKRILSNHMDGRYSFIRLVRYREDRRYKAVATTPYHGQ